MTETKCSIAWKSFNSNLFVGLSLLQQNQEFVDMTLAADGHYVKVHQMVLSLASPYLKELIKSAPCPHPVLLLNNISHRTLSYILEYIYSGEVDINMEHLNEFLEAGRVLHIKGLEAMDMGATKIGYETTIHLENVLGSQNTPSKLPLNEQNQARNINFESVQVDDMPELEKNESLKQYDRNKPLIIEDESDVDMPQSEQDLDDSIPDHSSGDRTGQSKSLASKPTLQYTLSNQGSLQLILNRYLYLFRYNYKKGRPPARLWRCSDNKCPATVTTRDDIVIQRVSAHNHPFHDKKIMNKLRSGLVFTAIRDAEAKGKEMVNRTEEMVNITDACIIIRPDYGEADLIEDIKNKYK